MADQVSMLLSCHFHISWSRKAREDLKIGLEAVFHAESIFHNVVASFSTRQALQSRARTTVQCEACNSHGCCVDGYAEEGEEEVRGYLQESEGQQSFIEFPMCGVDKPNWHGGAHEHHLKVSIMFHVCGWLPCGNRYADNNGVRRVYLSEAEADQVRVLGKLKGGLDKLDKQAGQLNEVLQQQHLINTKMEQVNACNMTELEEAVEEFKRASLEPEPSGEYEEFRPEDANTPPASPDELTEVIKNMEL